MLKAPCARGCSEGLEDAGQIPLRRQLVTVRVDALQDSTLEMGRDGLRCAHLRFCLRKSYCGRSYPGRRLPLIAGYGRVQSQRLPCRLLEVGH